jgi:hypothetical protein
VAEDEATGDGVAEDGATGDRAAGDVAAEATGDEESGAAGDTGWSDVFGRRRNYLTTKISKLLTFFFVIILRFILRFSFSTLIHHKINLIMSFLPKCFLPKLHLTFFPFSKSL